MVSTRTGRSTSSSEPASRSAAEVKKPATRGRRAKDPSDDLDTAPDTSGAAPYTGSPHSKPGVQTDHTATAGPDSPPDVTASDIRQPVSRVTSPVVLKATPVASKDTPVLHNSTIVPPASARPQTRLTATRSQIAFPSSPPKSPSLAPTSPGRDISAAEQVRVVHHVPLPQSPPLRAPPPPASASDDDSHPIDRPSVRAFTAQGRTEPHTSEPLQPNEPSHTRSQQRPAAARPLLIAALLAVPLLLLAVLLLPALCSWLPTSGLPPKLTSSVKSSLCSPVQAASSRVQDAGAQLQSGALHFTKRVRGHVAKATSASSQYLTSTLPSQIQQQLQRSSAAIRSIVSPTKRQQGDDAQPASGPYTSPLSLDALTALLPSSSGWADRAADFLQVAETQAVEKRKAAALLLTGRDGGAAAVALRSVLEGSCALHLDGAGRSAGQSAASPAAAWSGGALQAELSSFLSRCPTGIVVLDNVSFLPPRAVAVLNNALSEAGGLTQAGRTVPTSRALFILPHTTAIAAGSGGDEGHGAFERAVKDEVTAALKATAAAAIASPDASSPAAAASSEAASPSEAADPTAIFSSFRRRLDAVFAVREPEGVLDAEAAVVPDAALVTAAEGDVEGSSAGVPLVEVPLPEIAAESEVSAAA